MTFETLSWDEAFSRFGEAWSAIVEDQGLNPSLLPGWQASIVSALTEPGSVSVVIQREQQELTAALPYRMRRDRIGIPVNIIEPLSSVVSYHAQLVTRARPEALLEGFLAAIEKLPWHVLRITDVPTESATATAIRQLGANTRMVLIEYPGVQSPFLTVTQTWDEIVASRDKKRRYQMRRRKKDFEALPDSYERYYEAPEETDTLLEAIEQIERLSWKDSAGVAIHSNPHEVEYHRQLLPWLARHNALRGDVLYTGNTPIAYELFCHWGKRWAGALKGSFSERFGGIGAGNYSLETTLERIIRQGVGEIDFLGNADENKTAWTSTIRPHSDFYLFRSKGRGAILGRVQRLRHQRRQAAVSAD